MIEGAKPAPFPGFVADYVSDFGGFLWRISEPPL